MNVRRHEIAAVRRAPQRSLSDAAFHARARLRRVARERRRAPHARPLWRPRRRGARLRPPRLDRGDRAQSTRARASRRTRCRCTVRDEAAEELAAFGPPGLGRVFFVNSGAEANENALRLALKVTGRTQNRRDGTWLPRAHGGGGGRDVGRAANRGTVFRARRSTCSSSPRDDVAALTPPWTRAPRPHHRARAGFAGAFDFSTEFLHAARAALRPRRRAVDHRRGADRHGPARRAVRRAAHGVRPDLLTVAKGLGGGFPCGAVLMPHEIARSPEGRTRSARRSAAALWRARPSRP